MHRFSTAILPNWVTVVCLVVIICPCNFGMGQSKEALSGVDRPQETIVELPIYEESEVDTTNLDWLNEIKVGYDKGFLIASKKSLDLDAAENPFRLKFNGWGQLRSVSIDSNGANPDQNQFQLQRARIALSGSAFTEDFSYFLQMDGRSSSGDDIRLLDYYLDYDIGHHSWGFDPDSLVFQTGRFKMPTNLARELSGKGFQFADRSVASTFFDVNRSLGWGLYGRAKKWRRPFNWSVAIFNGLVTGGAETGSSGSLDNNFAYSARTSWYPCGDWGSGQLSDFDYHHSPATRVGAGWASSAINRTGSTEFNSVRVVDSGKKLSLMLPMTVDQYRVNLYSIDASIKYAGWSWTSEYYFRQISDFQGAAIPELFDHGFWLQAGKFVIPEKCELVARWSRVEGESGLLGAGTESSDEIAGGFAWYLRGENAKLVIDLTRLNGAPIDSAALSIAPGDSGWLLRSQIQFAF